MKKQACLPSSTRLPGPYEPPSGPKPRVLIGREAGCYFDTPRLSANGNRPSGKVPARFSKSTRPFFADFKKKNPNLTYLTFFTLAQLTVKSRETLEDPLKTEKANKSSPKRGHIERELWPWRLRTQRH